MTQLWQRSRPKRHHLSSPMWRLLCFGILCVSTGMPAKAQSVAVAADPALAGIQRATVFVEVTRPSGDATGSGVIVRTDGIIVTAAHVLRNATRATIKIPNGEKYRIEGIIDVDEELDVAIVKIEADSLPIAKIRTADDVPVGSRLYAVGSPLGLEGTVSDGLLSAYRNEDGIRLMQVSVPVSPGSSGGPVATASGDVVGIVVSGISGGGAQNLNFVLPARYFRSRVETANAASMRRLTEIRWTVSERKLEATSSGVGDSPPALPAVPRVNDSLDLNPRSIDGLSYFFAVDEGGYTTATNTRYGVTRSVDGRTVINRTETRRIVKRGGMLTPAFLSAESADEQQWALGGNNSFNGLYRVQDYDRGTTGTLSISGRDEMFGVRPGGTMDGTLRSVRRIPNGVVPPSFTVLPVIAWRGPLPDTLEYWSAEVDKPDPILIQFVKRRVTTAKIPLAPVGEKCTADSRPKMTSVKVIVGQFKIGGNQTERMFLAQEPHVPVIPGARCVEIPR